MDKLNLLQKAYKKIQEYNDWNIKAESEKLRFQNLSSSILSLQKEKDELEKEIDALKAFKAKEFTDYIDELEDSDAKINEMQNELIRVDSALVNAKLGLGADIEKLKKEKEDIEKILEPLRKEVADLNKKNSANKEEVELLKTDITGLQKTAVELVRAIKNSQDELRQAGETIAAARERQKELEIYERRIQRYYKEANLKIKI